MSGQKAPRAARRRRDDVRGARLRAPGEGVVRVEAVLGGRSRSVVTESVAAAPLKLLAPRNCGHAAWVFTSSFGGGLVDGDHLRLGVEVARGAAVFLGSQSSTKVYRAEASGGRQDLTARVGDEALLVAAPDHVACFARARFEQRISIDLAPSASLVLVDAVTAGRVARGERWAFARYASRIAIDCGGAPRLRDAVVLDPLHGELAARLGRFEAMATLVVLGPRAAPLLYEAPRAPPSRRADLVEAVSPLPGGLVARLASTSIEALLGRIRSRLAGLAEMLGDDPFARRW